MTIVQPWALALVGLALPIVLAYLYRLHRDKRRVPSAILLRAIRDERPASRRARSRLRHKLSLILVLIALAAAIVAIVGPRPSSDDAARLVIVLDRSASMGTRDADGVRLERAAREVADLASAAPDGTEVALVVAGGDAGIEVAPTKNHADIAAAAHAVAERGATGDNRDDAIAFRLADGLCTDPERASIVIVSDGAGLSPAKLRCPLRSIAIGRDADNAGIAAVSARALDGLGGYDIHLAVASSAAEHKHVDVTLSAGGQVIDVVGFEVASHGDSEKTLRVAIDPAIRNNVLVTSIAAGDALALDDRAEVPLNDAGPVSVLLVSTRRNSLVAEALRVHPRVQLAIAAPNAIPNKAVDLVVLEAAPASPLPPSRHVIALGVGAGDGAPITLEDTEAERTIVRWDFDSPWFRFVDLHDLVLAKGRLVKGGRSVVDSRSGALVAVASWGDRELVVAGFSLDETDLALRASFPNLIANLVEWAAPPGAVGAARGVLSSAETHVEPKPLPGASAPTLERWRDGPWLARLALILAVALLLVEQAAYLRRTA